MAERRGGGERREGGGREVGTEERNLLSHSITPPLAHPTRLSSLQAPPRTTTRHTVRDPMGHLVDHDVVLHRSITAGLKEDEVLKRAIGSEKPKKTHVGKCPDEHPTLTRLPTKTHPIPSSAPSFPKTTQKKKGHSLRRRGKIRIVNPRSILHTHQNPIPLPPALPKVTLLEIERLLGKPIPIRKVMHAINDIKRVRLGCVDVGCNGGVLRVRVHPVEVEACGGLSGGGGEGGFE